MKKFCFFDYLYLVQVKKVPAQYRHSCLQVMFQFSINLLVKFCYEIKQLSRLPLVFVKAVEIIQKKSDFPVFCPRFTLLVFQPSIILHNILRLFDVLPNFISPQVKRCAIITYRLGIYDVPHKFPNDLRLKIVGN